MNRRLAVCKRATSKLRTRQPRKVTVRYHFLAVFVLFMGPLPALADLCGTLHNVHRLEIELRDGPSVPTTHLATILRLGTQLSEYYINDAAAARAVGSYVQSLSLIHSPRRALSPADRMLEHLSDPHRLRLRTLRVHSDLLCQNGLPAGRKCCGPALPATSMCCFRLGPTTLQHGPST